MANITDIETHSTEEQRAAIEQARCHIREDGDRAGKLIMSDDFNLRLDQWKQPDNDGGDYVRTWIAYPNGRLTWKS
jgi:hypothetical protein